MIIGIRPPDACSNIIMLILDHWDGWIYFQQNHLKELQYITLSLVGCRFKVASLYALPLGLLSFVLYINDLADNLSLEVYLFCWRCKIYISKHADAIDAQKDSNEMCEWISKSLQSLNVSNASK